MRAVMLALLAVATPLAARDLPVPADKGWQHAETGLILTAAIDGLPRTMLTDLTASEHDIAAEFATPDRSTVATIYLFHPAVDNVAMWFERSETALLSRASFGDVAPASADPIAFAPPDSTTASALRRIYSPAKGGYRATGLAVMPLGPWLVAVRLSSRSESTTALDARLTRVISGLRWPAGVAPSSAVAPIPACAVPLAFDRKAKRAKSQGGDLLLALLGGSIARAADAKGATSEPVRWCRDPASAASYGVYRNAAHDVGYTLALQDAGRVVTVAPSLDAQIGKGHAYTVTLTDVDGTTVGFPGFDALPSPDHVAAALSGPRLGASNGNRITLSKDAL